MKEIHSFVIVCFLMLQTGFLFSEKPVDMLRIDYLENGIPDFVVIKGGDYGTEYADGEVCPSDHKTTAGNRFAHAHITFVLPAQGLSLINNEGKQIFITKAMVKDYWDYQYSLKYPGTGYPPYIDTGGRRLPGIAMVGLWGTIAG